MSWPNDLIHMNECHCKTNEIRLSELRIGKSGLILCDSVQTAPIWSNIKKSKNQVHNKRRKKTQKRKRGLNAFLVFHSSSLIIHLTIASSANFLKSKLYFLKTFQLTVLWLSFFGVNIFGVGRSPFISFVQLKTLLCQRREDLRELGVWKNLFLLVLRTCLVVKSSPQEF